MIRAEQRRLGSVPLPDKVPQSSIVMKAIDATTFSELQAFTKDLEGRPTERLLRDVAELVLPSESKAHIVGYVLATKYRHADATERRRMLDKLEITAAQLAAGEQRDRVAAIAERLRTQEN
jgi:hypothetical protein